MSDITPARLRRAKGDLRISGFAYIAFGIWAIIKIAIQIAMGLVDPLDEELLDSYSPTIIYISMIITMFIISGVILIIHFYVGFSALRFSKDPKSGRAFLYFAIFFFIFYLLEIPALILSVFFYNNSSQDTTIASILLEITTAFVLFDLIRSGFILSKSVKESPKET